MSSAVRTLTGDPLGTADRTLALRSAVDDAAIEWALAEREHVSTRSNFRAATAGIQLVGSDGTDCATHVIDTRDDPFLSRVAGAYLDAAKREHEALERYKRAARALVEALEGKATP